MTNWRESCLDLIMPPLTIRHVTTYRYRQPVAFGEHRMMLRPRDSHDQRVIEASLEISPEPRSLRFVQVRCDVKRRGGFCHRKIAAVVARSTGPGSIPCGGK